MAGRNKARSSLIYILKVLDADTGKLLGFLWDASTDGLNVISEKPMEVGHQYSLMVAHPKGEEEAVHVTARSMWSRPDVESDFYRTGLQLLPSQTPAVKRLAEMVEQYRFVDPPDDWATDIRE